MSSKYSVRIPKTSKKPNTASASALRGTTSAETEKKEEKDYNPLDYYKTARSESEKEYKRAGESLSRDTEERLRRATVGYELLKKYLPIENEQAGLSGLGVSESAGIEARNGYARRVGEIESAHDEKKAALDASYQKERASLAEHYAEGQAEADALAFEREKHTRAAQDSAYESALDILKSEKINSEKDLDRLLASVKPHVRDEQYSMLEYYVAYYKNNPDFFG